MPDSWVVVTGASSGIGRATAEKLLAQGHGVVATARTEADLAEAFGDDDRVRIVPVDLSDIDGIASYAKRVADEVGPVRGLVHCAARQETLALTMAKPADVAALFAVNTFAALELIRNFARNGRFDRDGASFVLLSSLAAHEGSVGNAIYAATKGALEGYLAPAAAELVRRKIRLNVVVPGFVHTRMTKAFTDKVSDEQLEKLRAEYPLGFGAPSDVAGLIAFLLGPDSSWITGQSFVVDGGHSIRF